MGDFYNNYQQLQFGFQSRPACGPCQPQFEELGYVAYTPLPGSRGLEDQLQGATGFWQSLADPSLGECVNAFGGTGRLAIANSPYFGCGFGEYGGGHGDGGYTDGGHGGAESHHAYYGSPYVQPFAQSTQVPYHYLGPQHSYGPSTPYAKHPSQQGTMDSPEELAGFLTRQEIRENILDNYSAYRQSKYQSSGGHANTHGNEHGNSHGSIGNAHSKSHLSDVDVLAKQMKESEGFKGFLRSRLEKESGWFSEGDVDTDGLARLATEYFSENPEELHGRHLSATEVESACFQYIEHNKDNHWNWDASKTGALAVAGVAGAAIGVTPGGWAVIPGLISAGSLASAFGMKDDFELNKGDMANIH